MILKKLTSNNKTFRQIDFKPGFNIILAERGTKSSKKDSRNGLGKTLSLEIIDYCLGSNKDSSSGLNRQQLEGWTFTLELEIHNVTYKVTRSIDEPKSVIVETENSTQISGFEKIATNEYKTSIIEWREFLGKTTFKLEQYDKPTIHPTFRNLASHLLRYDNESFISAFKSFASERVSYIQVSNAFLIGLNWQLASELSFVKEQIDSLHDVQRAVNKGMLPNLSGSVGEMEAEATNIEIEAGKIDKQLSTFQVHPQYHKIQEEANLITAKIARLNNDLNINKQIRDKYKESLVKEKEEFGVTDLKNTYKEAGVVLGDIIVKRMNEVEEFHIKLIKNRKLFLQSEISRLNNLVTKDEDEVRSHSNHRARLLNILKTHSALDEYSLLQSRSSEIHQKSVSIRESIKQIKELQQRLSKLVIEKESIVSKLRKDYDERVDYIRKAISIFSENSQFLYSVPGKLTIDVTESGYKFNVEIERAGSQGVNNMKIFCYDLMLMESGNINDYKILIHDSTMFDGVDERQIAKALELISQKCTGRFQYICTLNSDIVPYGEFSEEFKRIFKERTVITLTDGDEKGSLLGIRY